MDSSGSIEGERVVVPWTLSPGKTIPRTELHRRFGRGQRGGIAPLRRSPNILVFTDPSRGNVHGYVDQWDGDVLHFYGEGQRGDQQLTKGNKAIAEHKERGHSLRVFQGAGGVVTYLGEFAIDTDEPY
jgi:hypothetical protein